MGCSQTKLRDPRAYSLSVHRIPNDYYCITQEKIKKAGGVKHYFSTGETFVLFDEVDQSHYLVQNLQGNLNTNHLNGIFININGAKLFNMRRLMQNYEER